MRLPMVTGALIVASTAAGCARPDAPDASGGCPSFADTVVTNPDGVATDDEIAEAEAALAGFATWTGADGVCVGEVRLVADVDPDLERITGSFSASDQLVLVEPESDLGIARTVVHELCHAWDAQEGFSDAYADLVPTSWDSEPDLYDLDSVPPPSERFAFDCSFGPRPRALAEAAVAACGAEDPWQATLREEVFPGYLESIPVGIGHAFTAREVEISGLPDHLGAYPILPHDDELVTVLSGDTRSLVHLDLATLDARPIEVPATEGQRIGLLATLPDARPVVTVRDASDTLTLHALDGDELVDPPADWIAPLLEEGVVYLSVGQTGAMWQRWGDGLPMQARAFDGGDAYDVSGPETLYPSGTALPEGELAWEWGAFSDAPWVVAGATATPAWVPPGVTPTATLPDGRVVATASWESADGARQLWLLRDTEDDWWLSPSSCDAEGAGGIFSGGGRIVRVAGTAPLRLEELVED